MAGSVDRAGAFVLRHRGFFAVVLVVAAALFAGLYRVADGAEKHSYNSGAVPPTTVRLTQGHSYEISVPGGRDALANRGIATAQAQCSWSQEGRPDEVLNVTAISAGVRPTHAIATFVAPVSGQVHINCPEWGAVYVDDSDDSGWDYAGLFLVLTAICLTLGVALLLSALYARSAGRSRDDDEVEAGVAARGGYDEVGGPDGGDVAP